ncbi:hypothetical protein CP500_001630 [Tychonema bourrellyi FEM_GT703]|uniref:Uncharacterized protein n=1 Tax=Tychonema bourrellyi FEM_GT703 TaxID=2040638 RepID=A0A2G4F5U2_9CYAN|nr:hypothetical protein CP500_001630 [Tychonema bourrellyi FEM_GT703]
MIVDFSLLTVWIFEQHRNSVGWVEALRNPTLILEELGFAKPQPNFAKPNTDFRRVGFRKASTQLCETQH